MGILNTLKQWPLLFIAVFISFCCKSRQKEYVYYEKWKIQDVNSPNPLKGRPSEVKEITYNSPEDTTFAAPGEPSYYILYRFDSTGNRIFTRFGYSQQFFEAYETYDKDGPGSKLVAYDSLSDPRPKNISKSVSERIGNDSFKTTHYYNGKYKDHFMISFSQSDEIVREEGWINTIPAGTTIKHYTNGKLLWEETLKQKNKSEEKYYYSDKGFLDSIISFDNGERFRSRVYQNNEHGDPLLSIENYQDSVTKKTHMNYQYDEKGNWVKQLIFTEINKIKNFGRADLLRKFPDYSIVTREIKY